VSLLPGLRKRLSDKPDHYLVGDEVGVRKLIREAADERIVRRPPPLSSPDVMAIIGETPLLIRVRVPICSVYVVHPTNVPSPTRDDLDLALGVARTIEIKE
jgi:hypothetical protein